MEIEEVTKDKIGEKKVEKKRKENFTNHQEQTQELQSKFFIDLRKEPEQLQMILNALRVANNKNYGREIILKDLVLVAIPKLTSKDIERIQEQSLNEMERVQRLCDEYNEKNNLNLSLGEFLIKKFNL